MRPVISLLIASALLASSACRTTHVATEEEMAEVQSVSSTVNQSTDASGDQGEASLGAMWATYPSLIALSDKEERGGFGPLPMTADGERLTVDEAVLLGSFLGREKAAWDACIAETDSGVEYSECEWGLSSTGGSVEFLVDGHYNWTDSSVDMDLLFDLAVGSDNFSLDWTMAWKGASEWTDTLIDGWFELDYAYGVSLGGTPPLGAVTLKLDASVETLTWDEGCSSGPVAGIIDWKSVYRQGTDTDRRLVTIEFTDCGTAEITW